MHDQSVALITGANKGIGFQIARDLAGHGFTVLIGSRQLTQGETAAQQIGGPAHAIQLNVTDQASIEAAAARIQSEFGRLDVLVNNAGIASIGAGKPGQTFLERAKENRLSSVPQSDLRAIWETNVFGVVAVTQAMLPLLRAAPAARIVNVSSGGGSLTLNADPSNTHRQLFGAYSTSKVALNAITLGFAIDLESSGIKVNAADPGFTATDLNGFAGLKTVEEGAREPVRLALLGADGPTGTFSNDRGLVPW